MKPEQLLDLEDSVYSYEGRELLHRLTDKQLSLTEILAVTTLLDDTISQLQNDKLWNELKNSNNKIDFTRLQTIPHQITQLSNSPQPTPDQRIPTYTLLAQAAHDYTRLRTRTDLTETETLFIEKIETARNIFKIEKLLPEINKTLNTPYAARAAEEIRRNPKSHQLTHLIKNTNITNHPTLQQTLLTHPSNLVRKAALESALTNIEKDRDTFEKISTLLINNTEPDLHIRALIANYSINKTTLQTLATCPELPITHILQTKGFTTTPTVKNSYTGNQEQLLRTKATIPSWGKPVPLPTLKPNANMFGQLPPVGPPESMFRYETTAARIATILDPRLPLPPEYNIDMVKRAREQYNNLPNWASGEKHGNVLSPKNSWPAYELTLRGCDPLAADKDFMLAKLVDEYGLSFIESSNSGRETINRTVITKALETTLGSAQYRHYTPPLHPIKQINDDGTEREVSSQERTEIEIGYGLDNFAELIQIIQKETINEARDRTGLTHLTVTRGMYMSVEEAKELNITANETPASVSLEATSLKYASASSASPCPVPLYGTRVSDGVNVVVVTKLALEQFYGISGVGFADSCDIELDVPFGPGVNTAPAVVVSSRVNDKDSTRAFEDAIETQYRKFNEPSRSINLQTTKTPVNISR